MGCHASEYKKLPKIWWHGPFKLHNICHLNDIKIFTANKEFMPITYVTKCRNKIGGEERGGGRGIDILYTWKGNYTNLCVNNVHNGHFTCMVEDKAQKSAHPTKSRPTF